MNVSKQYKENRDERAFLTIRKYQINLLPSNNFLPKIVPFTGTVPFTYFVGYSESILCYFNRNNYYMYITHMYLASVCSCNMRIKSTCLSCTIESVFDLHQISENTLCFSSPAPKAHM